MDFSAYSDFAIGVSRVMGIRVPENFNWPYLATNIQEFWNRWHMSLSTWVRDYVFSTVGRQLFKTPIAASPRGDRNGELLRDISRGRRVARPGDPTSSCGAPITARW